jgi:transcriptional regulator with XRE-family HTH domain
MIVKKLRTNKNWSQEQLASFSGLSIRTIQRVESGQSASIETLKALASVFEVDISKLTEEITMIDKKSENWKIQPWWFRTAFFGVPSRRFQVWFEIIFLLAGVLLLLIEHNFENAIVGDRDRIVAVIFIICAYIAGWTVRYGDKKQLW